MCRFDISKNEYTVTQKKQGALTIQYVFQSFTRTSINLQLAGANLGRNPVGCTSLTMSTHE